MFTYAVQLHVNVMRLFVYYVGGNAGDLQSLADLDKMITVSMRDVPDDDSDDDLSDTDDPNLMVGHSLVI